MALSFLGVVASYLLEVVDLSFLGLWVGPFLEEAVSFLGEDLSFQMEVEAVLLGVGLSSLEEEASFLGVVPFLVVEDHPFPTVESLKVGVGSLSVVQMM